jgi:hypothetical protein
MSQDVDQSDTASGAVGAMMRERVSKVPVSRGENSARKSTSSVATYRSFST